MDSFFPSGGYAFSSGLEAAVQHGALHSAEDVRGYVAGLLVRELGVREAVAVAEAQKAAERGELKRALLADCELDAMMVCRETRLASRQMGRQVYRIAASHGPLLKEFQVTAEAGRTPGHLPVSLGLALGACGWEKEAAIAAYLYQSSVGLVSAALKLLRIGQGEAQHLLESLLPLIERLSREAAQPRPMSCWAPLEEIYAMRHAQLDMRLFRS
ncbi:MAG TPA: urease accessory UreF family protein [Nitrospirales bacterium]